MQILWKKSTCSMECTSPALWLSRRLPESRRPATRAPRLSWRCIGVQLLEVPLEERLDVVEGQLEGHFVESDERPLQPQAEVVAPAEDCGGEGTVHNFTSMVFVDVASNLWPDVRQNRRRRRECNMSLLLHRFKAIVLPIEVFPIEVINGVLLHPQRGTQGSTTK